MSPLTTLDSTVSSVNFKSTWQFQEGSNRIKAKSCSTAMGQTFGADGLGHTAHVHYRNKSCVPTIGAFTCLNWWHARPQGLRVCTWGTMIFMSPMPSSTASRERFVSPIWNPVNIMGLSQLDVCGRWLRKNRLWAEKGYRSLLKDRGRQQKSWANPLKLSQAILWSEMPDFAFMGPQSTGYPLQRTHL